MRGRLLLSAIRLLYWEFYGIKRFSQRPTIPETPTLAAITHSYL